MLRLPFKDVLVRLASFALTVGGVQLLLADSANSCEQRNYDETFDVVTTCGGEHTAKIRVFGASEKQVAEFKVLSGELAPVVEIRPLGSLCDEQEKPWELVGLSFGLKLSTANEGGSSGASGSSGSANATPTGGNGSDVETEWCDVRTFGESTTCFAHDKPYYYGPDECTFLVTQVK